jgi:hypothetical protein
MRTKAFVAAVALLWITGSCTREEPARVQPARVAGQKPELRLYAVSAADIAKRTKLRTTGSSTIVVRMNIVGMSILNTKKDNDPFYLLVPEVGGPDPHEPFLLADARYKMTSASTARPVLKEPTGAPKFDVMILDDDDLTISPSANETLSYTIGGSGSCPLLTRDLQSLRWAPSMSEVLGKTVSINPDFLKANPLSTGLAARMRIDKGYLASTPTYYYLWQFKETATQTAGHVQMLTSTVVHEYTVDLPAGTSVLSIASQNFAAGSSPTTLITLEPYNGKVEFYIGTTMKSERIPGSGTASDEDIHYKEFYKTVLDSSGAAVSSNIHPFQVAGAQCIPPTTTLVNCGPGRP